MTNVNDVVFNDENLRTAADSNSQIKLKGNKYYVGEGKKCYLWFAIRMGMPTVKDAPGLRDYSDLKPIDPRLDCGDGYEETFVDYHSL